MPAASKLVRLRGAGRRGPRKRSRFVEVAAPRSKNVRRPIVILLVTVGLTVAVDLSRPPSSQWMTSGALMAIHMYRQRLSPLLVRSGYACRFTPTCSRYAEAVLTRDGFVKGSWKATARLVRCGPWTRLGSVDPP